MFVLYQTAIDDSLEPAGRPELQLCDGKSSLIIDHAGLQSRISASRVAITEADSGPMKGLVRLWAKAMPKSSVCLRVTIPKPVAALLNDDLDLATAAVLPCQIQAATPVRPYAASPGRKAPPTPPAPPSPCGNNRDLTACPEMFVCCFVER
jgi:hypothetical protein